MIDTQIDGYCSTSNNVTDCNDHDENEITEDEDTVKGDYDSANSYESTCDDEETYVHRIRKCMICACY